MDQDLLGTRSRTGLCCEDCGDEVGVSGSRIVAQAEVATFVEAHADCVNVTIRMRVSGG